MTKTTSILFIFVFLLGLSVKGVSANHSWGGYHWARTANPFNLRLGDNLSSNWKPFLTTTSNDWSASSILNTNVVSGQARKNCSATPGQVEVCNKKYGNNGWLGIAQVWVNGLHITQGLTKMNDTYFNTPRYNTTAWKNLVLCQEVGHTLGLDHQDEVFDNPNMGTCMDYTNNPETNQHPNAHDYEELETIYVHLDTTTTLSQTSNQTVRQTVLDDLENASQWGRLISNNGKVAKYERQMFDGSKVFTFVVWAE